MQTKILKMMSNLLIEQRKFFKACFLAGYSSATARSIIEASQKTHFTPLELFHILKYESLLIDQNLKDYILQPSKNMKQVVSILQEFREVINEQ